MQKTYFGGSRHPHNINTAQVRAVVHMCAAFGHSVHVGCQFGADQAVISSAQSYTPLHIFTVAPQSNAPAHVVGAVATGQAVGHFLAGGTSAPIPARYLLRSIAAFQGCSQAVFFSPGSGSLSVARHALAAGIPVYIFAQSAPVLPVPAVAGSFFGFACWQYTPATQPTLF